MPFRSEFNQKTHKFETFRISSTGRIFSQNGQFVPKQQAPLSVRKKAEEIKQTSGVFGRATKR